MHPIGILHLHAVGGDVQAAGLGHHAHAALLHLPDERLTVHTEGLVGQTVQHLHHSDLVANLLQVQAGLTAHQAAAHHHHLVTGLDLAVVHIHGLPGVLDTGNRGTGGDRAGGENHAVRPKAVQILRGDLGAQTDLDVTPLHLTHQHILEVAQVGLIHIHIGKAEQAAHVIGLIHQNHLLAPVAGSDGRLHTGSAGAHNEHGFTLGGRGQRVRVKGQVCQGIDGAVPHIQRQLLAGVGQVVIALLGGAGEALVAAQAAADAVLLSALGLVGKLGVGQHLAAQNHKVHLALGNGLLAHLGGVDAAHSAHGQLGVPLYDGGGVDIQAVGVEHTALGARLDRLLIDAAGDVHRGDVGLGHGHKAAGLLGGDAAGLVVGAVNAQLHQEVGANSLTHSLENLQGELGTVLQAAAELVVTGVHQRGEELGEQEAVSAVDEHAVKAGLLHIGGGHSEVIGDAVHIRLVHGTHLHPCQVGALHRAHSFLTGAEGHLLLAAVHQLSQGHRTVALDAAGILTHSLEGIHILFRLCKVKGTEAGNAHSVGEVDIRLTHNHAGVSALGAALQLAVGEITGGGVLHNQAEGHGCADDAVAIGHLAHLHGRKQMGELHAASPLSHKIDKEISGILTGC